jgi:phosphatidylglycerophosphate synthase
MKTREYTLQDIKETAGYNGIWPQFILYPISQRMLWIIANYTKLTPNQVTITSFLIGLLSAWCFLQGTYFYLILGAFLFELSFTFDLTDGALARLKGLKSAFGGYLDSMLDQTRIFSVVLCLVYGQYLLTKDASYFLFGMLYVFLYLMHWIGVYKVYTIERNFYKDIEENITYKNHIKDKFPLITKNIKFLPDFAEADALAFFIFPILIQIKLGLLLGSIILFVQILIKASYFFLIRWK